MRAVCCNSSIVGGVGYVGLDPGLLGYGERYGSPEIRGVLVGRLAEVAQHGFVYAVDASFDRLDKPAAAYDDREEPDVDSLLFKGVENQTQPPFELVRYAVESAYFFT